MSNPNKLINKCTPLSQCCGYLLFHLIWKSLDGDVPLECPLHRMTLIVRKWNKSTTQAQ